jgi:putative DNA primase/helicase
VEQAALPIVEALMKWSDDERVITMLRNARPVMPLGLGDRSEDICEPLFAIADLAGGDWPALARRALVRLRAKGPTDEEEIKIQLLMAIREIIQNWGHDAISSKDLLTELVERDGEPWGVWWKKDVDFANTRGPAAKMAKILKPFGIVPRTIRDLDCTTPKGYPLAAFDEPFERYLPPFDPETPPPSDSTSMPIPPKKTPQRHDPLFMRLGGRFVAFA